MPEATERKLHLPRYAVSFHLHHNQHLSYYETVQQTIADDSGYYGERSWVSPEERLRAIETNELWTAQWYPDTPVGFHVLHASSLDALNEAMSLSD